ncbi:UDP-N-acetylglucosamine 2-epimerase [Thermofilum sp.]|uniref:UDP-N-acetylglucosamine 2-epimerase n=1 Tax=Thermofilum sp. TaxID=1961369 RepID=UPI0038676F2A
MGYLEFLSLLKNAKVVVTDSGVQEEAFTLKVPTATLRYTPRDRKRRCTGSTCFLRPSGSA